MNKKGVELSMNLIIIAAVGLLVLLVVSAIFLTRIGFFSKQSVNCAIAGGTCAPECGSDLYKTQDKTLVDTTKICPPDTAGTNQVCCLPIKI